MGQSQSRFHRRNARCEKCGKPTYAGCGLHIEAVLGDQNRVLPISTVSVTGISRMLSRLLGGKLAAALSLSKLRIGAGAAGMMCAIEAGKRGRKVLVLDHAKAAGEKIRISGGGRCNFTNINTNGMTKNTASQMMAGRPSRYGASRPDFLRFDVGVVTNPWEYPRTSRSTCRFHPGS